MTRSVLAEGWSSPPKPRIYRAYFSFPNRYLWQVSNPLGGRMDWFVSAIEWATRENSKILGGDHVG